MLEPQHVLRLGLIVLGIHVRRDETDRRNPIAAHGLGQAAQISRGRHHLDAILRNSRRCQDTKRDYESQTQRHGLGMDLGKERAAKPRPFPRLQLALAGAGHPDALRHDAMDIFLRIGDGANPAIHRHTGETIGIETRQLLL